MPRNNKFINITGNRYGKLLVIKRSDVRKPYTRSIFWLCICECGNETIVSGAQLRAEATKSCGCISKDRLAEWQKNKTHCPRNHPYNKENTVIYSDGSRRCKICAKITRQEFYLKNSDIEKNRSKKYLEEIMNNPIKRMLKNTSKRIWYQKKYNGIIPDESSTGLFKKESI